MMSMGCVASQPEAHEETDRTATTWQRQLGPQKQSIHSARISQAGPILIY
jgi:hypothetical protein